MNVVYVIYWLDSENNIISITICDSQEIAIDYVLKHESFEDLVQDFLEDFEADETYHTKEETIEILKDKLYTSEGIEAYCYIDSETIIQ